MATAPIERPRISIKPLHLIGFAMIALAIGLGWAGLQSAFRPYTTSIAEAEASARSVQLKGFLGTTGGYDAQNNFVFDLQDETGKLVKVIYPKPRPSNFEQAVSIVVIGHYDAQKQAFLADDMLVQCPSKYQEMEGQHPEGIKVNPTN
ncbi:cytochrome c maturation protein CcmE [Chloroflexia bacterium SDU3-3]|nr:cytochrome c maturation protein CcmE [Chloroflexia bacterium SDU3-3]